MVKILAALVAALSILNSSGASPGATEKVAALVGRATCSGASHSSGCCEVEKNIKIIFGALWKLWKQRRYSLIAFRSNCTKHASMGGGAVN